MKRIESGREVWKGVAVSTTWRVLSEDGVGVSASGSGSMISGKGPCERLLRRFALGSEKTSVNDMFFFGDDSIVASLFFVLFFVA